MVQDRPWTVTPVSRVEPAEVDPLNPRVTDWPGWTTVSQSNGTAVNAVPEVLIVAPQLPVTPAAGVTENREVQPFHVTGDVFVSTTSTVKPPGQTARKFTVAAQKVLLGGGGVVVDGAGGLGVDGCGTGAGVGGRGVGVGVGAGGRGLGCGAGPVGAGAAVGSG